MNHCKFNIESTLIHCPIKLLPYCMTIEQFAFSIHSISLFLFNIHTTSKQYFFDVYVRCSNDEPLTKISLETQKTFQNNSKQYKKPYFNSIKN